jgi:hypothetical protein
MAQKKKEKEEREAAERALSNSGSGLTSDSASKKQLDREVRTSS